MPLLRHTLLGYPFDIKSFMWSEIHRYYVGFLGKPFVI
jgi:hypothetical protein